MRFGSRLLFYSTVLWLGFTTALFGIISVLIYTTQNFPLGLGWLQTHGRNGLLVTIPNFLLGITGIVLLFLNRRAGARLVLVYSVFWVANFTWAVFSILPTIIRHPLAVCSSGTCDSLPVALTVIAGVAICGLWSSLETFRRVTRLRSE